MIGLILLWFLPPSLAFNQWNKPALEDSPPAFLNSFKNLNQGPNSLISPQDDFVQFNFTLKGYDDNLAEFGSQRSSEMNTESQQIVHQEQETLNQVGSKLSKIRQDLMQFQLQVLEEFNREVMTQGEACVNQYKISSQHYIQRLLNLEEEAFVQDKMNFKQGLNNAGEEANKEEEEELEKNPNQVYSQDMEM